MRKIYNKRGLSIVEVMIYISIFGLIWSGAVVSIYSITESMNKNKTNSTIEEEAQFIIGKIKWALYDSSEINLPIKNTTGNKLSLEKEIDSIKTTVILKPSQNGKNIEIQIAQNTSLPLNSSLVRVSDLKFAYEVKNDNKTKIVIFSFDLNSTTTNGLVIQKTFKDNVYLKI
jgi:type II secretory pathway pseudopilin PulG